MKADFESIILYYYVLVDSIHIESINFMMPIYNICPVMLVVPCA